MRNTLSGYVHSNECPADHQAQCGVLQAAVVAGKDCFWREEDDVRRAVLDHVQYEY